MQGAEILIALVVIALVLLILWVVVRSAVRSATKHGDR